MGAVNPMATREFNVTSFQARVGSLYFPNSQITGPGEIQASADCYFLALKSFGQYNNNTPSHMSSSYASYLSESSVLAVGLERSNVLDVSGIPLSNSRTLAFNITFSDTTNNNGTLFLEYLTVARVFLSNATVEV